MTPYISGILLSLLELFLIAVLCICFHHRGDKIGSRRGFEQGYQRGEDHGYQRGYHDGRRSADNWWVGSDIQLDTEREKVRDEERWP